MLEQIAIENIGISSVKCEECEEIYPVPVIDIILKEVNEDRLNNNVNIIDLIQ